MIQANRIPLALYVHLPWCEHKCPYCDFNSHAGAVDSAYIPALLSDLQSALRLIGGRSIRSIFIGGGTPSLFSAEALGELLDGIRTRVTLAPDAEITLEANPSSAEAAKFCAFREIGINRLSVGVQSFQDNFLCSLGRVHDREQALAAIDMIKHAGFKRWNLDLMFGLPKQSVNQALEDLHTALRQSATHLSWYQLTLEPNTPFARKPPALPKEKVLLEIHSQGGNLLTQQSLENYEISAWATPGETCRHNLNYWEFGDYLGIGAGAHSKITLGDGQIIRQTRHRNPASYMRRAAQDNPVSGTRTLQTTELPLEFFMNALRLAAGVPSALFSERTGMALEDIAPLLENLREQRLLSPKADRLQATPRGLEILDDVLQRFLPEEKSPRKSSKKR